jgi:hypothetical protein
MKDDEELLSSSNKKSNKTTEKKKLVQIFRKLHKKPLAAHLSESFQYLSSIVCALQECNSIMHESSP